MKRFRFINAEKGNFPLWLLCRTMGVSQSGYFAFCKRVPTARQKQDDVLCQEIKTAFAQGRGHYGSVRVTRSLNKKKIRVGRNRVIRLMQKEGLKPKRKPPFRPCTTDSNHKMPVAPNRLDRKFSIEENPKSNQTWVGDVTYVPTLRGWLYLAVLLDLASRRVVGWALSKHIDTKLVTDALDQACQTRRPRKGLLVHSDRGSNYTSFEARACFENHGATQSMSRKGNCWDNAVAESFFKTLKAECNGLDGKSNPEEVQFALFDYIETFYNPVRLHSTLGFRSPIEYENEVLTS